LRLLFDIETDNFVEHLTKIHCIAALNVDQPDQRWSFGPDKINDGIELLQSASELIAHNGICFDIPAIKKLYPSFSTHEMVVTDTLVLSRLLHADMKNEDADRAFTGKTDFPKKYLGSHSLKAWGYRLGALKGDFGETTDWSEWTPEMQSYCEQDVTVCHKLYEALAIQKWSKRAIDFEHKIAEICHRIGRSGWTFDTVNAGKLYGELAQERADIDAELQDLFPAWTIDEEFIPKVNNSKRGYQKGVPFIKKHIVQFNPNSRKHIEYCLRQKYNWKPKLFTPSGDAKVDESVLVNLPFPEAQKLARSFMLQKRIGQLAEGNNAWLKLADDDGKLRHTINPMGTVTGRASSFGPNLQQVPAVRAAFGKQCRRLFTVPSGYQLVGSDLAGIELRCLAHFLQDGGEFGREVCDGDIHQKNADMTGLSRDGAKTMVYALCYNAGDKRLGEIIGKGPKEGRALRDKFYKANPAFADLLRQLDAVVEQRGYLIGLDGRRLTVRGHAKLNVLLQSAAALIAKKWVELIDNAITEQGLPDTIVAWVHDEVQIQTKGDADVTGLLAGRMAKEAGRHFNFEIPIEAEYKVGQNWADTH